MRQFDLPAPVDDGLFVPDVGPWSRGKHHFLRRYLDGFTHAMANNPKWKGLHYIDLFAGAGVERTERPDGSSSLDWGSPLLAAQTRKPFTQLHLVEMDRRRFDALTARLSRFPQPNPPQLIQGDANSEVGNVMSSIPPGVLSVAFLDPFGLHLHFTTLRRLASRPVDLIIFFPDHVDALRNWELNYEDDTNSNLDRVLGDAPWRQKKQATPQDRWADMLTKLYVQHIKMLGYMQFDYERICRTDARPLYRLIFCSKDPAGGKIWRGTTKKKPGGQDTFDFGQPR